MDFAILVVIQKYEEDNDKSPTERQLLKQEDGEFTGLINEWLAAEGILALPFVESMRYERTLKSYDNLRKSVARLRSNDLVQKGKFGLTEKGLKLALYVAGTFRTAFEYPLQAVIADDGSIVNEQSVFGDKR